MSDSISGETRKRKACEQIILVSVRNQLPIECKATVKRHINSIYVSSIVRIFDKKIWTGWAISDRALGFGGQIDYL